MVVRILKSCVQTPGGMLQMRQAQIGHQQGSLQACCSACFHWRDRQARSLNKFWRNTQEHI